MDASPPALGQANSLGVPPAWTGLRERDERLMALKALVNQLGHDFKNLLVPLLGYATLLKEELGDNTALLEFIEKLVNSARKSESFLDAVLMAVRPQRRFAPKTTDFTALLERAIRDWKTSLPPSAAVTVLVQLAPCTLKADENHWRDVFQHLFNNARFALAAGGTLNVASRPRTLTAEEMAVLNVASAQVVELVVEDNGVGMSKDLLNRVCEPFFSTRPKSVSSGLGLTLAHSVAQCHGGQLLVESAPDAGTRVSIWLPINASFPQPAKPNYLPPISSTTSRHAANQILLVLSDSVARDAIKAYLQQNLPCEVMVAHDRNECAKLIEKSGFHPKVVVAEIAQLQTDGVQLCHLICNHRPDARVVLILEDAGGDADKILESYGAMRPLILKKPLPLKTLAETIRPHLATG